MPALLDPTQRAGLSLSATARELQRLLSGQQHLAAGLAAVRQLRRLLARCCQVGWREGGGGRVLGGRTPKAVCRLAWSMMTRMSNKASPSRQGRGRGQFMV